MTHKSPDLAFIENRARQYKECWENTVTKPRELWEEEYFIACDVLVLLDELRATKKRKRGSRA